MTHAQRGSRYIDRRTANNVVNMAAELHDIAERLVMFGFDGEANRAALMATQLGRFGIELAHAIGDERRFIRARQEGS
jgi:hypothetical protein